jgi:hypothetical protein
MRDPYIFCSEDGLGYPKGFGRRLAQHLGCFVHQIKGREQKNSKKGFLTSRLPKNEGIRGMFVLEL